MYISYIDLHLMKRLIFDSQEEVCGNFLTKEEVRRSKIEIKQEEQEDLNIYISSVGTEHSCEHKFYSKYIWHTHPDIGKAYPSPTDFMKVLRNNITSFVFTSWGIWELYADKPKTIDAITRHKLETKYLKPIGNKIYEYTERGRSISLTSEQHHSITHFSDKLVKLFNSLGYGIHVNFTEWKDIDGDYEIINKM